METAGPKRAEERVNPGSNHGAGSVEGRVSVCLGLVSLVGDEEFRQEASCRELAWGLSVDSSFRSFIGGKREKKMALHLIPSPGAAEGLSRGRKQWWKASHRTVGGKGKLFLLTINVRIGAGLSRTASDPLTLGLAAVAFLFACVLSLSLCNRAGLLTGGGLLCLHGFIHNSLALLNTVHVCFLFPPEKNCIGDSAVRALFSKMAYSTVES